MLHIDEFKTFIYYKGKIYNCFIFFAKKERVIAMDERKNNVLEMTNEEYREELNKIFSDIHENYKLRWFYVFITEKLRSSR